MIVDIRRRADGITVVTFSDGRVRELRNVRLRRRPYDRERER